MDNRIIFTAIGLILGLIIFRAFFYPDFTESIEVEERVTVDTVYVEVRDTIRIERRDVQIEYIRDTIIQEQSFPINQFSGLKPTLYGDIGYMGLVAGHFLNLDLTTNFRIPQINQTIERDRKVSQTVKPRGLYVGGSVSDHVQWSAGASYLDNLWLFDYRYDVGIGSHSVGVKRKVF
jgi:hypothetical protein